MESPSEPRRARGLLATVIVLGVLLVIGFVVVFGTIAVRVMSASDEGARPARPGFGLTELLIEPQARVRDVMLSDGRLAVHVSDGDRDEIILVDPKRGTELGRIRLRPKTDLATRR